MISSSFIRITSSSLFRRRKNLQLLSYPLYRTFSKGISESLHNVIDELRSQKKLIPIYMPKILNATEGCLTHWTKSEGSSFHWGDNILEFTIGPAEIIYPAPASSLFRGRGVLAIQLVNEGEYVPVGKELGMIAPTEEAYKEFLHEKFNAEKEEQLLREQKEALLEREREKIEEEREKEWSSSIEGLPDHIVMLREVKALMLSKDIDPNSGKKK